jgi:hypothetical protein
MKYEIFSMDFIFHIWRRSRRERDSSGTTVAANGGEGDGADSPTRAADAQAHLWCA